MELSVTRPTVCPTVTGTADAATVDRPWGKGIRMTGLATTDGRGSGSDGSEMPWEQHRTELTAYCYRMLGSAADAEDAVQDTMVRAWKGFDRFEGRAALRSWLYRIATNVCLTMLEGRKRRARPMDFGPSSTADSALGPPLPESTWLQPVPDAMVLPAAADPADMAVSRESIRLAFVAALQHLPGNQRAALLLFEVLGFSAAEIASVMDTSTASVNSALQRARRIVAEKVPDRSQHGTLRDLDDARLRRVVADYSAALERGDADALVALLTEDVTWSMPPLPHWYRGIEAVTDFAVAVPLGACGAWRRIPTGANGQPAAASYLWDDTAGAFGAFAIDVLTLRGDRIGEITTFIGPEHVAAFGLPLTLGR